MALRADTIALTALVALAAPRASAQWRAEPMTVWLDASGEQVLVANFSAATSGDDVLQLYGTNTAALRPWHDLLSEGAPYAFPLPVASRAFRAVVLAQDNAIPLAAVASHASTEFPDQAAPIELVYGDPQVVHTCALSPVAHESPQDPFVASPVKLLQPLTGMTGPRDTIVLPYWLWDVPRLIYLVDVDQAGVCTERVLSVPYVNMAPEDQTAYGIRLSATALGNDVDDLAIGIYGGVLLYIQRTSSQQLSQLDLSDPIFVGTIWQGATYHPAFLPETIPVLAYTHGVAALDVNGDGNLDLVFTQSSTRESFRGGIVWVQGTGDPYDFADPARTPWHDLNVDFALGLSDPLLVRGLVVGGERAVAIWDRGTAEVLVLQGGMAPGTLRVWRAPAPGRRAKDILLADVVGSPAKDLVIAMDNSPLPDTVLVYPDDGLPWPELTWAPGSPGTPLRGVPHAMAVALDPSGPLTVDWIEGAPTTAPLASGVRLLQYVFPKDCSMPPPDLVVTVRAVDDTGVFTELHATLPIGALQPAIALEGADAPGRVHLRVGGTIATFDGVAATGCGAASWGGTWPALAGITDTSGDSWVRREVDLPEAAYPELLADPSLAVSLATTDPGVAQPVVTLPLEIDGSELVEVTHASDRSALADGDIAVLRTRLRSRIQVALPRVRVVDVLRGLAPAGPPSISGAAIVSSASGGADLVLDALPPAPAEVVIELPVRSAGGEGASAVEAWSEGGWPLTPPAGSGASQGLPGCGCGAGGGGSGLAVLALVLVARLRRRASRLA